MSWLHLFPHEFCENHDISSRLYLSLSWAHLCFILLMNLMRTVALQGTQGAELSALAAELEAAGRQRQALEADKAALEAAAVQQQVCIEGWGES